MTSRLSRKVVLRAAASILLGASLAGCVGSATNRSLDSVHQPIVERTNYTFDVTTGPGGMSVPEQRRLADWFEAMNLRYGDRIAIDDPLQSGATRAAVSAITDRYGLMLADEAPVTEGFVSAGTARIIVTRSTASVPHCPDWNTNTDGNPRNGTSSGYGCAINGNLAGMVANPEHLLHGDSAISDTTVMSSTKAIDAYRAKRPTGEAGLSQTSTRSGN